MTLRSIGSWSNVAGYKQKSLAEVVDFVCSSRMEFWYSGWVPR